MEFAWRFDSSAVLLRQSKMYATPIYPPFTNSSTYILTLQMLLFEEFLI